MQDSSTTNAGVQEGDLIAGKYRIEKVLGAGGMGYVVAAYHLQLDERVAIKFLLPEVLSNPEAVSRFTREARAAVKIKSEHVARVIDVGTLDSGAPYMVMEYLDGGDLSAWIEQRGALPIEQAVEFVLQASEAIADAHGLGIVHRDLKPANLFCIRRSDGVLSVKVLDFGISKVTGSQFTDAGLGMTRTTTIMGSPLYMSPEQLQSSRDVDARADIWSLGAIVFELLTGRPPFSGEALPELCIKIVNQPTPLIREFRPDVPVGLEQVICKCLEKDRRQRFLNVAELAVALAPFGPKRARSSVERIRGIIQSAGLSASVMALPPSSDVTSQPAPQTEVSWGQTAPPTGNRTKWIILGSLGFMAALGLALLAWAKTRAATHSESTTTSAAAAATLAQTAPSVGGLALPPTSATAVPIALAPTQGLDAGTTPQPPTRAESAATLAGHLTNASSAAKPAINSDKRPISDSKAQPTGSAKTPDKPAAAPTKPTGTTKRGVYDDMQ